MKHILVIGSVNMDLTIHTPRLPRLGETITGSGFATTPGGKGANQAVAAARLGGKVRMIGGVGKDAYADLLTANLRQAGVVTDGVSSFDTTSGIAVITVCGGDNHIILDKGANECLTPEFIDLQRSRMEWADLVLLQLEIPMQTILHAAALAKTCGAQVLLNPAPMQELPDELLRCTDIFVPNQHEAGQLLGREIATPGQAMEAARELHSRGIGQAIITLGSEGCVFCSKEDSFHAGIYPASVADTTAAGDCFIGAYAVGLCEGWGPRQAVRFATAASSITVSRRGASSSLPSRDEAEEVCRRPLDLR